MMTKKITAEMVKQLRERTGVGMGKCKEALEQVDGDIEKAIDHLRKTGIASAVKKEGREANEGLISVGESDKAFALLEVNSETDFVAQNDQFKEFLSDLSLEAATHQASSVEDLMKLPSAKDKSLTNDEYRALIIQKLGENIQVRRLLIITKADDLSIGVYSHMGGKIVTLVELSGGSGRELLARDLAMHVAAESPDYISEKDIPADAIKREEDIAKSQVQNKPANIIDKIVQGKLKAFYEQTCLLYQKFIKDNSLTVEMLLNQASKEANVQVQLKRFIRWRVGE